MWPIKVLTLGLLLAIFVQDMRYRLVYWILFPLLAIALLVLAVQAQAKEIVAVNVIINLAFLTLQWVVVALYFTISRRRWVPVVGELLGWGDVLLLLAITVYFSVINLILFYTGSLIIVLLVWLGVRKMVYVRQQQIPLAGMQAMILAMLLCVDWSIPGDRAFDNYWLINFTY